MLKLTFGVTFRWKFARPMRRCSWNYVASSILADKKGGGTNPQWEMVQEHHQHHLNDVESHGHLAQF